MGYSCEESLLFIEYAVLRQGAYHIETARNELIKLPVFEIKCRAMMGICIYWISRHVVFGKRCKTVLAMLVMMMVMIMMMLVMMMIMVMMMTTMIMMMSVMM